MGRDTAMPVRTTGPLDSGPRVGGVTSDIHYCTPELGHRTHWLVGVGRVPGWYVFTRQGCILRTYGPFASEAEARAELDAQPR